MKPTVTVLAPVLDRPQRAQPLADSLFATVGHNVALWFLCSPGDDAEIKACRRVPQAETFVMPFPRENGDYARKINFGVRRSESDWIFHGADDLRFHPGWLEEAIEAASRAPGVGVVGTQDLGNKLVLRGRHSTHSLVSRAYAEQGTVDDPDSLMHEGYRHNFVDTEMVETALARRAFTFARRSVVEHLHPNWRDPTTRKPKAETDATYKLGLRDFRVDQLHFFERRPLWQGRRRRSRRDPR